MKICNKCGKKKPLTEFYKNRRSKDGLSFRCKECVKAYARTYRAEHREEVKAYYRDYYAKHHEERNAYCREYNRAHKTEKDAYHRDYAAQYPERRQAKHALNNAIAARKVIRPNHCSNPYCDCTENIQGHHWSYKEEHYLDVIWACCSCHRCIHSTGQAETRDINWKLIQSTKRLIPT